MDKRTNEKLIMQQVFHDINIKTKGQGLYDFTKETLNWLNKQKIVNGILNINILHTSASLVIQENADPDVLHDLKFFLINWFLWKISSINTQPKAKMICRHTLNQRLQIISLP